MYLGLGTEDDPANALQLFFGTTVMERMLADVQDFETGRDLLLYFERGVECFGPGKQLLPHSKQSAKAAEMGRQVHLFDFVVSRVVQLGVVESPHARLPVRQATI